MEGYTYMCDLRRVEFQPVKFWIKEFLRRISAHHVLRITEWDLRRLYVVRF